MSESNATMSKAEALATQAGGIPLNRAALIGIVGTADALSALVRLSDGSIAKLKAGDRTKAGVVIAVDAVSIRIKGTRGVQVLEMPRG